MKIITTLGLIFNDDKVLLGMKKRGFGAHRWNGFGGKISENENIVDAAKREIHEECGIEVQAIEPRGVISFSFTDKDLEIEMHVFVVTSFSGEPAESEEMQPQWFARDAIPYHEMWAADAYWIPHVLDGHTVNATVQFDSPENHTILYKNIQIDA